MSIALMSIIWEIRFPTQSQTLIALKLADYANDDGSSIYPARDTIADKAGCSLTTVRVTLKAFRDCGLLHVVREGGHGPGSVNEYKLNVELLADLAEGKCSLSGCSDTLEIASGEPVENKGANFAHLARIRGQLAPIRGQSSTDKGADFAPNPSKNHQIEPSARSRAGETQSSPASRASEKQGKPHLVMAGDATWALWLSHARNQMGPKSEAAFIQAGAMVVCNGRPFKGCKAPMLPPGRGSAKWAELVEARPPSLADRITGDAA